MFRITQLIKDFFRGYPILGGRSSDWPRVRKEHLEMNPNCAVCGGKKKLNVHHIKAFHTNPDDELNPQNLITLCEKNSCHLIFGHLGSYLSINEDVVEDTRAFHDKVKNRKVAS